jgi:hypothetical protein
MPVYSHKMITNLSYSLDNLAGMFFSKMPLILTPSEFVAGFINPDHVEKLNDVQELVGHVGRTDTTSKLADTDGVVIPVYITFGGRPPIILPQYTSGGLQPTCPNDVREKVTSWVTERVRFGDAFGDARDAIHELNQLCSDVETMSALLPCLPLVMSNISADEDSKTTKRAQSLAHNKKVRVIPRILRETKNRLIEVSSIVNSASLLGDAPVPETPKNHAHIVLRQWHNNERPKRTNIFDIGGQIFREAAFL